MTFGDPHDMHGIGCPDSRVMNLCPSGNPKPMSVRSMDVSAKMESQYVPQSEPFGGRSWYVLWLVGGAVLWFSPDEGP